MVRIESAVLLSAGQDTYSFTCRELESATTMATGQSDLSGDRECTSTERSKHLGTEVIAQLHRWAVLQSANKRMMTRATISTMFQQFQRHVLYRRTCALVVIAESAGRLLWPCFVFLRFADLEVPSDSDFSATWMRVDSSPSDRTDECDDTDSASTSFAFDLITRHRK